MRALLDNLRCLLGRHTYYVPDNCSHLRHCSRCERAYTGLARQWSRERRAKGQPWAREWIRAFLFRDPTWECRPGNVWRALAWPADFGD